MKVVLKNVYFDVCVINSIVNKYNNTYHNTIKMKPIDVKSNFILNTMLMLMLIILNLNRQPF